MPLIGVNQLGKSFGAERIFSGVSFQIEEHDRIGLVGPNGAGKSTLLHILAGREEADAGTVAVARSVRIGYLTQVVAFQPQHTLREELLTVFAQLRQWEQELHELANSMASAEAQHDASRHEQLLHRYDELQTRLEHAGGYTYENRGLYARAAGSACDAAQWGTADQSCARQTAVAGTRCVATRRANKPSGSGRIGMVRNVSLELARRGGDRCS